MTVPPASVTRRRLIELLEEGSECEWLDYKETLDPNQKRDLIKLAKHVGAMQVNGGYIVIGADSHGRPSGLFHLRNPKVFDEASLRGKLEHWIPEPFDLRSAIHEVDGHSFVLIYTNREDECCIFAEDGRYTKADGKQDVLFQKNDIFVRHGSSSVKAEQHDLNRILRRPVMPAEPARLADETPSNPTPKGPHDANRGKDESHSHALEAVRHILSIEYDMDWNRIVPNADLSKDLGLERSEVLELIMTVEEALGLDIPDNSFVGVESTTIADLVSLFHSHRLTTGPVAM